MKTGKFLPKIAVIVCLLCLVLSAAAQTKKRKSVRRSNRSTAAATAAAANTAEIKESAEKVATQLVTISRYLYLLGGITQNIQNTDQASANTGRTSSTNTKNKQAVIASIGNIRAGLAALESEFQEKPFLQPYFSKIQGISDIAANAEDQANSGQFVNSGKTLLQVVEKLSDTLVAMP